MIKHSSILYNGCFQILLNLALELKEKAEIFFMIFEIVMIN
jgi:hypothetical protein